MKRTASPLPGILLVAVCLLLCPGAASAWQAEEADPPSEAEIEAAVETGREALDQGWISREHPWYDERTDSVRRIRFSQPKTRSSFGSWSFLPDLLSIAGWGALAIALLALVYFLVMAWLRRDRGAESATDASPLDDRGRDVDRVEALPFKLGRQTTDLLGEARRHYEAGDYSEAILYLFSHQLVELDRHQIIRLVRGKTNRQCVREIGPRRVLRQLVEETMVAFEDVFFGDHKLSRARFEACWFRVDEFHGLLREAVA